MSLITKTTIKLDKVKELQQNLYEPHKFSLCHTHHLHKQLICIHSKCNHRYELICEQCHQNSSHILLSVKKIVPKLKGWLLKQWATLKDEQKQIQSEWKVCLANVNYCIDILKQIAKQIQQRSKKTDLSVFIELTNQIYGMHSHDHSNISPEMLVKNFQKINEKYNLFKSDEDTVQCEAGQSERNLIKEKVKAASAKTKQFSQKALVFSQNLAEIIEQKLKSQKRKNKLKEISNNHTFSLRDLMNKKDQSKIEQINELILQVPKQNKQPFQLNDLLPKCKNLKLICINNKNGAIQKSNWKKIVLSFENLKFLKQISLKIKAKDLPFLTELFTQRSKAVRQIDRLNLQITDEKQLQISQVYNFCNTLELKYLCLTLARNNLTKKHILDLITGLRVHTQLSQLPLQQFILNLNKNRIDSGKDTQQIENNFGIKTKQIKTKSIVL